MDNEQVPVVGRVRDFLSKFDSDEDNNQIKQGMLSNPSTPNAKRKVMASLMVGQKIEKCSSEPNVDNPNETQMKATKSEDLISNKEVRRNAFSLFLIKSCVWGFPVAVGACAYRGGFSLNCLFYFVCNICCVFLF